MVAALAEVLAARGDGLLRADHHQPVTRLDPLVSGGHPHHPVVFDPTERDSGIPAAQVVERWARIRGHEHCPVDDPLRPCRLPRRFELGRQVEVTAEQQRGDHQHRDHGRRIRERVRHDWVPGRNCFARGLQRWCVRRAAGEQASAIGRREPEEVSHEGAHAGERDRQCRRDRDCSRAAPPQPAEKRRPGRQPDRVGEQDETELAQQGQALGAAQRLVERANGDAHEQRRGRAQRHAFDPHRAEARPKADGQEHEQDRVVRDDIDDGAELEHGFRHPCLGADRAGLSATRPSPSSTGSADAEDQRADRIGSIVGAPRRPDAREHLARSGHWCPFRARCSAGRPGATRRRDPAGARAPGRRPPASPSLRRRRRRRSRRSRRCGPRWPRRSSTAAGRAASHP